MEIRLRPGTLHYKKRLKGKIDIWFVAAIVGLLGIGRVTLSPESLKKAARRIHGRFGIPVSDEHERRMTQWLANDPHDPKTVGRHIYTADEFGLAPLALRELRV